jgi:uncharacterized membrane protein
MRLIVSMVACFVIFLLSQLPAMAQDNNTAQSATSARSQPTASPNQKIDESFVVGKVKSVTASTVDERLRERTGIVSQHQLVEIEITEGPLAGKTVVIPNEVTDNPAYNIIAKPGKEVILSVIQGHGAPETYIADYNRTPYIAWLLAAFFLVFLIFGGKQGVKSLAGLIICVALIFLVLLPAALHGYNPLLVAVITCLLACATTMFFVAGFSRKAASAALGTICGVIIAGLAAQAVIYSAPLTGLTSEDAQILRGSILNQPPEFYSGLLAAGMLIGALGVIMDVGISIASTVFEVSQTDRSLPVAALYKSGMNVGRDIMGTMTTTLVLAYAGGAMPLLMLVAYMPSAKLLNLDLVATEVTAALSGSLGLVCTIPITAFIAANLMAGASSRRLAARSLPPQDLFANAANNSSLLANSKDPFTHLQKIEHDNSSSANKFMEGKSNQEKSLK